MDFKSNNLDCVRRVQRYLAHGTRKLYGLFQHGTIIGFFSNVEELMDQFNKHPNALIMPIFVETKDPKDIDYDYYSKEANILNTINNIRNEQNTVGFPSIGWIEIELLFIMQNPYLLASNLRVRDVVTKKLNDLKHDPKYENIHFSEIIMSEFPAFLCGIRRNRCYIRDVLPPHKYNLRERKKTSE